MPSSPNVAAFSLIEPIYIQADSTISLPSPPHSPMPLAPLQCNQIISQVNENGDGERRKTEDGSKGRNRDGKVYRIIYTIRLKWRVEAWQRSSKSQQLWQEREADRDSDRERERGTKQRGYHGHTHIYPFINGYVMRQGRKRV